MWQTMKAADDLDYLLSAAVDYKVSGSMTNDCGIVQMHAYSVLSAFEMTDSDSTVHKMYLIRNPWGITEYSNDWNKNDSRWTDDLVS